MNNPVYRGKLLKIRQSEFTGQDGQLIRGYNLDIKLNRTDAMHIWSNEKLDENLVGSTMDFECSERVSGGKMKYTLIKATSPETEHEEPGF